MMKILTSRVEKHGIPRASQVPSTDVAREKELKKIEESKHLVDLVQSKVTIRNLALCWNAHTEL